MDKNQHDNFLRLQCLSIPDLAALQLAGCFSPALDQILAKAEVKAAERVVITGCGDSYMAALAIKPVFEKIGAFRSVDAMRAIDFSRFVSKLDLGERALVIAISASGGPARIEEVLRKAKAVGAATILVTNRPESRSSTATDNLFVVGTPAFPNDFPGLRSYFGSMVGLIAIALGSAVNKGLMPAADVDLWKKAIADTVAPYAGAMSALDDQMFEVAKAWKDLAHYDFVGDEAGYATAFFGAAKVIECAGSFCTWDDSEDWCHVNYFLKDPGSIGTVFHAAKGAPSFGRIVETLGSAQKIGRKVLVVTDAEPSAFIEGVTVCRIPSPPAGFECLMPLVDYIPTSLLAGFLSSLKGEPFFRRRLTADGKPDTATTWASGVNTIANSKIEIFE